MVYESALAATTNYHGLEKKKKKTLFSIVLGAGKLKFYVQADLAFDEGSPSSLQMAAFLLIFP